MIITPFINSRGLIRSNRKRIVSSEIFRNKYLCLTDRERGVAQSGRALGWGPSGRWFESSLPDQPVRLYFFKLLSGFVS